MKYTRTYLVIAFVLSGLSLSAQNIRGSLSNAFTDQPVFDAIISFLDNQMSVLSDRSGQFVITGLEPGRYVLRIQHIQFHAAEVEVLLTTAKDVLLNVELEPRTVALLEVSVPGRAVVQPRRLYRITQEEVRRYPGTFFDPARFAASFPGVQIANDQANQLVIHGLHPDLMQWRLEGMEIINPNHLANAGTVGDRASSTGGGVNMLSNLMLGNSSLVTGAFSSKFGNAISGVMDMHFRNGNNAKAEHTAQLGLLGIDVATEGPFRSGGLSTYVVNARYSTVGLLTDLGVDFGDEAINFADVSFHARFQLSEHGSNLSFFGFGGFNTNDLSPKDPEDWEEDRDRSDVDYESMAGAIGVQWTQPVSSQSILRIGTTLSATDQQRSEERLTAQDRIIEGREDGMISKWSTSIVFSSVSSRNMRFTLGADLTRHAQILEGDAAQGSYRFEGDDAEWIIRPFGTARFGIGRIAQLQLGAGLSHYSYFSDLQNTDNGISFFEPLLGIHVYPSENQHLSAIYKRSSQALYRYIMVHESGKPANLHLKPVLADIVQLKYQYAFPISVLEGSLFYYDLQNVPVSAEAVSDYSALNLGRLPNSRILADEGTATSYGATLGFRRNFSHSYFISANVSVFRSFYTGSDNVKRSTTFDTRHALYLSIGKEWRSQKNYGYRTFGMNASLIERGGLRTAEIDENGSESAMRTVYINGTAGDHRLDGYFRVDMRIYLRKDKDSHSSTWSLDIQNVFNVENQWLPTYDFFQGTIRQDTQLGIIPVLNYRIDF